MLQRKLIVFQKKSIKLTQNSFNYNQFSTSKYLIDQEDFFPKLHKSQFGKNNQSKSKDIQLKKHDPQAHLPKFSDVIVFRDNSVEKQNQNLIKKSKRKNLIGSVSTFLSAVAFASPYPYLTIPFLMGGFTFLYGSNLDKNLIQNTVQYMEFLEDHEHVKICTGQGSSKSREIAVEIQSIKIQDIFDFRAQIDQIEQRNEAKRLETRELYSMMVELTDVNDKKYRNITFNMDLNKNSPIFISNTELFESIITGDQNACKQYSYQEKEQTSDNLQEEEEQQEQNESQK